MFFSLKKKVPDEQDSKEGKTKVNEAKASVSISYASDNKNSKMQKYFNKAQASYEEGMVVDGRVIELGRNEVYIDLPPYGTGIIYGSEYLSSLDILQNLSIGDEVSATVILERNDEGYIELSLREARKALIWNELIQGMKNKTVYDVIPTEANRGGLIIRFKGMNGFLPASQLSGTNYPKVMDGNKDAIMAELKKLINKTIRAIIIVADPKDESLIFSEREITAEKEGATKSGDAPVYEEGQVIEGIVTGIVDFGLFVKIDETTEGLVHISEIDYGLISDPRKLYKVGDKVNVKIVGVKDEKYSMSIKALLKNPWEEIANKYKKGDVIDAVILKHSEYGLLAAIEEGIAGLVHISIFSNEEDMREKYQLGTSHRFVISSLDPGEQKISLVPKELAKETTKETIS